MHTPTLAFDPGGTTGFAVLDENARLRFTYPIVIDALDDFLECLDILGAAWVGIVDIVIEIGPQYEHHSPVTRRVEARLREKFPTAFLVQPSEWKSHPATRQIKLRSSITMHEKDAARLGYWFQVRRESEEDPSRTNPNSTRRKRN